MKMLKKVFTFLFIFGFWSVQNSSADDLYGKKSETGNVFGDKKEEGAPQFNIKGMNKQNQDFVNNYLNEVDKYAKKYYSEQLKPQKPEMSPETEVKEAPGTIKKEPSAKLPENLHTQQPAPIDQQSADYYKSLVGTEGGNEPSQNNNLQKPNNKIKINEQDKF